MLIRFISCSPAMAAVSTQLGWLEGRFLRERLFRLAAYRDLFHVNANLVVRTLGLLFAMAFFTSRGVTQGDTVLSAYYLHYRRTRWRHLPKPLASS